MRDAGLGRGDADWHIGGHPAPVASISVDVRWRRFGCARLFDLHFELDPGDLQATFSFHPTDERILRQLASLARRRSWILNVGGLRSTVPAPAALLAQLRDTWRTAQLGGPSS